MNNNHKKIILFGLPRSGTTWLSEMLSYDNDFRLVHEPDNEANSFLGLVYKSGLPRFPYLTENDQNENYETLFRVALDHSVSESNSIKNKICLRLTGQNKEKIQQSLHDYNTGLPYHSEFMGWLIKTLMIGKKSDCNVIVKSVHGFLSIPFLLKKLDFIPVFIFRNPLNVFSSYHSMKMLDQDRKLYERKDILNTFDIPSIHASEKSLPFLSGYQIGGFYKIIESYILENPSIIALNYEEIISSPMKEVPKVFEKINVPFSSKTKDFMLSKFKQGSGYETNRNPKEQLSVYKDRLTPKEIQDFLEGYKLSKGEIDFEIG